MLKRSFILILILFLASVVQGTELKIGALGDCDIVINAETNKINLWAFSNNPAGLRWDSSREYTYNKFLADTLESEGDESSFLTYSGTLGYYYPFGQDSAFFTEIGISNSKLIQDDSEEDQGKGNLVIVGYNIVLQKFLSLGVSGAYSVDNTIDFVDGIQTTSTTVNWNIGLAFKLGQNMRLGFSIFPSYIYYQNNYLSDLMEFKLNGENFGSSINLITREGQDLRFGINLMTLTDTVSPDVDIDLPNILEDTAIHSNFYKRIFEFKLRHDVSKSFTYGFTVLLEQNSEEQKNKREEFLYSLDNNYIEIGFGVGFHYKDYLSLYSEYYSFEEQEQDKLSEVKIKNTGNELKYGGEIKFLKRFVLRGGFVDSKSETKEDTKNTFGIGYYEGEKTFVDVYYTIEEEKFINGEETVITVSRFGFASRINF